MTEAQMETIRQALAFRFADAEFEVNHLPNTMQPWHPTELSPQLQDLYERLKNAKDWQDLTAISGYRVAVHRLNSYLPKYLRVIVKKGVGYKLVDRRVEK